MRQYVQADLEADRKVATTLAELIEGGLLASVPLSAEGGREGRDDATWAGLAEPDPVLPIRLQNPMKRGPRLCASGL